MNEAPYFNTPIERSHLRSFEGDAVQLARDTGAIGAQSIELRDSVEKLASQISRLQERLEPITYPRPEKCEAAPCVPASTPLGQHLAETNRDLRVQVVRLASIIDSLGL